MSTAVVTERRNAPRQPVDAAQGRLRLRLGHEMVILNVSRHGILIEGDARLQPGSRVELQMESPASYVGALIARCEVSRLEESKVTYRAGLTFAEPFAFDWLVGPTSTPE